MLHEQIWNAHKIVVQEEHQFSCSGMYPYVTGCARASMRRAKHAELTGRPDSPQHFRGAVGGSIHYNDDFEFIWREILGQQKRQGAFEDTPSIERGNHHREL